MIRKIAFRPPHDGQTLHILGGVLASRESQVLACFLCIIDVRNQHSTQLYAGRNVFVGNACRQQRRLGSVESVFKQRASLNRQQQPVLQYLA